MNPIQGVLTVSCCSGLILVETDGKSQFLVRIMMALGFPGGSDGKQFTWNAGDLGWIPGLGRSAGEGNRYPLQYSGLENSMII